MPLLITYQGRPIKRRRREGSGLRLHFYNPILGQPSQQIVVTQEQWQKFGRIQYVPRSQVPDVRRLAGS